MTKAAPVSAEQKRFNAIKDRICQTAEGAHLFKWLNFWEIEVKFSPDLDAPAAYVGHNNTDLKENKVKGGTLYLDPNAPDEFIMIGFFEAIRRAWHDKVANSEAPNRSVLCHLNMQRFAAADAMSFTAVMVHEHLKKVHDPQLLHTIMQFEPYIPLMDKIHTLTRYADSISFNKLRRAAFDAYFEIYRPQIAMMEESYTRGFLENLNELASSAYRETIKSYFDKTVDLEESRLARFDIIGAADYAYFGSAGFGLIGKQDNYLELDNLPPVNSPFYMMPTQPTYGMLEEFYNKYADVLAPTNFMGSTYRLNDNDHKMLSDIFKQFNQAKDEQGDQDNQPTATAPAPNDVTPGKKTKKERKKQRAQNKKR